MRWDGISIMSCYKGCLLSAPVITRSTARLFLTSRLNESRSIVTRRNIYSILNILDMLVHWYRWKNKKKNSCCCINFTDHESAELISINHKKSIDIAKNKIITYSKYVTYQRTQFSSPGYPDPKSLFRVTLDSVHFQS